MIIKNAHVFIDGEFHDVDVRFDEQKILEIGKQLRGDDIIDAKGNYLYAGFVETHMHGGFRKNFFPHNYDSTGSDWSEDDVRYIVAQLPKYGVTSVIPTLNSLSIEDSCRALRAIRKVRREHAGADPFKIHFERLPSMLP